jgi:hypothetical protein
LFEDTAVTTETTAEFTIHNRGNSPLKLTSAPTVLASEPFTFLWPPEKGLEIAPGGSLAVKIKFKPTSTGTFSTTVRIPTDKTDGNEFITLSAKTK